MTHNDHRGVLGVDVEVETVGLGRIAGVVGDHEDVLVLVSVDGLVHAQHRRAQQAGRCRVLLDGVGAVVVGGGGVGGLQPGDPLLVGPGLGVCRRLFVHHHQGTGAQEDQDLLGKLKQAGLKVNEADKAAFRAASKQIYDEFAAETPGGKEMIDKAVALGSAQ